MFVMCWWLTVYPPKSSGWSSGINVSLGSLWFLMNFMKISFTSWVNVKQEVKPPCLYVQWSVNRCFDEWSRKEKLLLRSSSTATYWVHFMIFLTFPECLWNKKNRRKRNFLFVASYSTSSWWFACGKRHNMTMNPCHSDLQPLSV